MSGIPSKNRIHENAILRLGFHNQFPGVYFPVFRADGVVYCRDFAFEVSLTARFLGTKLKENVAEGTVLERVQFYRRKIG